MTSHIRIRCKRADSFRRAGIVFTRAGVDIDPNALDETRLQAIIDEPELEVVATPAAEDRVVLIEGNALTQPLADLVEGARVMAELETDEAELDAAAAVEAAAPEGEEMASAEDVADPLPDALQQAAEAIAEPAVEAPSKPVKKAAKKAAKKAGAK